MYSGPKKKKRKFPTSRVSAADGDAFVHKTLAWWVLRSLLPSSGSHPSFLRLLQSPLPFFLVKKFPPTTCMLLFFLPTHFTFKDCSYYKVFTFHPQPPQTSPLQQCCLIRWWFPVPSSWPPPAFTPWSSSRCHPPVRWWRLPEAPPPRSTPTS